MRCAAVVLSAAAAAGLKQDWPDCSQEVDGHLVDNYTTFKPGSFGGAKFVNTTWDDTVFYTNVPDSTPPAAGWPVVVYMHGMTAGYRPYEELIQHYVSHGFAVIFPFIIGPKADSKLAPGKPYPVTNTNGSFVVKGVAFAHAQTVDQDSPLHGLLDVDNVGLCGHSMGATDSLRALGIGGLPGGKGGAKLSVTQHPGICNLGPPPYPYTWNHEEFANISMKVPVLFMTSSNDGAFRPAPYGGEAEETCFKGGVSVTPPGAGKGTAFVRWGGDSPAPGGAVDCDGSCVGAVPATGVAPGGHCCPFKSVPETPWVVTALKLYLQQGGSTASKCYPMLWGDGPDSLLAHPAADNTIVNPPPS